MKIPPTSIMAPGRGYSLPGVGILKTVNGQLVFQRWPRKRPVASTPREAANRETLYWATQIVPLMDSYQQMFARVVADQTQLAVRDLLFAALFGRLGTLIDFDGKKLFSMASYQDISATLDAIYQLKNGLLVRGETYWEGLEAGSPGQVLTIAADGSPGYAAPGGAGISEIYKSVPDIAPNQPSAAISGKGYFGRPLYPQSADTITGIRVWVTTLGAAAKAAATLYAGNATNGGLLAGALITTNVQQLLTLGLNTLPFAVPQTLTPRSWYYAGPWLDFPANTSFAQTAAAMAIENWISAVAAPPALAPSGGYLATTQMSWWLY
jgi:hypothetical protein